MTFDWNDLVTMRAVLSHREVPYTEQRSGELVHVTMGSAGVTALLEISGSYADDAQSGEWADAAIAAVIASGQQRDVVEAAALVAEAGMMLDEIAAAAMSGAVSFRVPSQN